MRKIIYISILINFGFKYAEYDCELNNGKYIVIYDKQFLDYPKFEFEIEGQNLTEIKPDLNKKYTIETLGNNSFRLKSLEKQTDSLTEFQKILTSNGQPYYEITNWGVL